MPDLQEPTGHSLRASVSGPTVREGAGARQGSTEALPHRRASENPPDATTSPIPLYRRVHLAPSTASTVSCRPSLTRRQDAHATVRQRRRALRRPPRREPHPPPPPPPARPPFLRPRRAAHA